jgi:hypothetical protein
MVECSDQVVDKFIGKMEMLMTLERNAELEETAGLLTRFSFKELEQRNLAITKLYIKEISTGVYGRVLVHLSRK